VRYCSGERAFLVAKKLTVCYRCPDVLSCRSKGGHFHVSQQSDSAVCNFTLATDEVFKDRAGERQKRTEWHRIVLWSKQAELAQQYLKKGNQVYIEGRIQSRQWDDKEGQKRTTYEIVGTAMRFLGSRGEAVAAAAGAGQDSEAHASAAPDEAVAAPEISDEDIPF